MGFNLRSIVERAASPEEAASWGTERSPNNPYPGPLPEGEGGIDGEAAFLLKRWEDRVRKLHPDATLFQRRLDRLKLTREAALDWLRPRAYPADRPLPSWATLLEESLSPESFSDDPFDRSALLGPLRGLDGPDEVLPRSRPVFLDAARPFLHVAMRRLRAVPAFSRWLHAAAIEDIGRILLHRISNMAARTLAYEVKQRSRAGELHGDTPEARYADFMSRHVGTSDGLWRLFEQYPVLARLLAVRTEQTIGQVTEIVERLDADAAEIAEWSKVVGGVSRRRSNRSPGGNPDVDRRLETPPTGGDRRLETPPTGGDRRLETPPTIDAVVQLRLGLSDPHADGRSVAILRFQSGCRLVYKPRSLAVDVAYGALVAWWNQLPGVPRLKSADVLSRADYGWAEFIAAADCQSTDEIAEYYRRQGAQTAIFHMLRGMDFHGENFIAHGAWPVPIDLECLFSAVHGKNSIESANIPPCFRRGGLLFPTCMPPQWKSGETGEICELDGGIGGNFGRSRTQSAAVWSGLETDQLAMSLERRPTSEQPNCLPRLAGQPIGPEAHVAPLLEGFRQAYDALAEHRAALLAPGGPLAALQRLSTRCLIRSTTEYTFLLSWALAPDQLTSGAAHDLAFEMLIKYGASFGNTLDWIDDEKRALWRRDVPFYISDVAARRLRSAAGEEVGPELATSSAEQVASLLDAASPEDRDWQCELLRGCLEMALVPEQPSSRIRQNAGDDSRIRQNAGVSVGTSLSPKSGDFGYGSRIRQNAGDGSRIRQSVGLSDGTSLPPKSGDFGYDSPLLTEAVRLGDVLARQALRDPRGVTWLSIEWELHDPNAVMLAPVRLGLYSGGAGIAIFLANLAAAADEPEFAELAVEALQFSAAHVAFTHAEWSGYRDRLAAFSSPYSQAYALTECGRLLHRDAMFDEALTVILRQNELPPVDNPDFVNGAAGTICVLLHLHALRPDDRLLARARHLAETLHRDCRSADGRAWTIPGADRPILGLGHGQIGIALALDRLDRALDLPWARQAVRQALEYEAEHFDSSVRDWPNRWYDDGQGRRMIGWCGGAAGHGLARLALRDGAADGPDLRRSIDQALATVQGRVQPLPQNLCCGEPGCFWLLAEAGRALGRPLLIDQARADAQALIQYRRDHGHWHMRPVTERETLPTLMGGMAGIGLSLLEARQPGAVSQVVLLR